MRKVKPPGKRRAAEMRDEKILDLIEYHKTYLALFQEEWEKRQREREGKAKG
jgi:hypothetical protein